MTKHLISLGSAFLVIALVFCLRTTGQDVANGNEPVGAALPNSEMIDVDGVRVDLAEAVPQWIVQVKAGDNKTRLKAASNIFRSCQEKKLSNARTIGDELVAAYRNESAVEVKMAMLATLDLMEHPALEDLLNKARQDSDPLVTNLVTLVREKRYLEPVVIRDH
jgi:hypothetical protein